MGIKNVLQDLTDDARDKQCYQHNHRSSQLLKGKEMFGSNIADGLLRNAKSNTI